MAAESPVLLIAPMAAAESILTAWVGCYSATSKHRAKANLSSLGGGGCQTVQLPEPLWTRSILLYEETVQQGDAWTRYGHRDDRQLDEVIGGGEAIAAFDVTKGEYPHRAVSQWQPKGCPWNQSRDKALPWRLARRQRTDVV